MCETAEDPSLSPMAVGYFKLQRLVHDPNVSYKNDLYSMRAMI